MKPLHLLLQRLADAGFEFVVVGGFAGVMHGAADVTEDLDICAALTLENVEKLRATLADLHPVHRITHKRLSFLEHPPAGQAVANLYLETDAGVLDILSNIAGVGDYARLKEQAVEIPLFGRRCRVISLDDLI
ncbi:MAG: nucleotidyltransferase, partial [Verrucomicrobiota bacterium]